VIKFDWGEGSLAPYPDYYDSDERILPAWAKAWMKREVLFEYNDTIWKIVSGGTHNNTPERTHKCDGPPCHPHPRRDMFVEYVRAVPYGQDVKTLVSAPCSHVDLADSLKQVQSKGRCFTPNMLSRAVPWENN
jgi:hypothetical protein